MVHSTRTGRNSRKVLTALLVLGSAATLSCLQQLDGGASAGSHPPPQDIPFGSVPDPGDGTIPTNTQTPQIQVVDDVGKGATGLATDACEQTSGQAKWILGKYCGACHEQGGASLGVPQFDCVTDFDKLVEPSRETDKPGVPFVMPGHPNSSRIFQRMADGSMPKPPLDATVKGPPRPTISDISVIEQWIRSCAPGAPPPSGTTIPSTSSTTTSSATTTSSTGAVSTSAAGGSTTVATGAGGSSGATSAGAGGAGGAPVQRDAGAGGAGGSGNGTADAGGGMAACAAPYSNTACGGYTPGQQVSRMGHNYTCANASCQSCATMFGCRPGATGCPAGNVWTDNGPCL